MLRAVLRDIRDTSIVTKKTPKELLEIMKEQGWKSVKRKYIENLEQPKRSIPKKGFDVNRAQDAIDGFLKMTEGVETW